MQRRTVLYDEVSFYRWWGGWGAVMEDGTMNGDGEDSHTSWPSTGSSLRSGVGDAAVKGVARLRSDAPDLPGRKCQTFAMCGTGSDSKAGGDVSVEDMMSTGQRCIPANSYKECGH